MNISKQSVGIIGILLAIAFVVAGFVIKTPDKHISYFSFDDNGYEEYVGGDAYNYIIEAELRGGEIAGAKSAKAVCFATAAILFTMSFSAFAENNKTKISETENQHGVEECSSPENVEEKNDRTDPETKEKEIGEASLNEEISQ